MPFRAGKRACFFGTNKNGLNPYCRWMPFRAAHDLGFAADEDIVLILIVGGCPFGHLGFAADEDIDTVLILIVGGCPFGQVHQDCFNKEQ